MSRRSQSTRGSAPAARGRPLTAAAAPRVGPASQGGLQEISSSALAIGVKRPGYGTAGTPIRAFVNVCPVQIPDKLIYQYDVVIMTESGEGKALPKRVNRKLFACLELQHPNDFPRGYVAYDGNKIAYSVRQLELGDRATPFKDFGIVFIDAEVDDPKPKAYKIRLTTVMDVEGRFIKTINPEILQRFVQGQQSNDIHVSEALGALHVVMRMQPASRYPVKGRSFYTDINKRPLLYGLEIWQGYIQSLRPARGRLLVNLDITSGVMYQSGTLSSLCIAFLCDRNIDRLQALSPSNPGYTERHHRKLSRFIVGMRVIPTIGASGQKMRKGKPVTVRSVTHVGANGVTFKPNGGAEVNVAEYFRLQNQPLTSPRTICIQTTTGAYYPIERCEVVPGQLFKKEMPPDVVAKVVEFATKSPRDRFDAIKSATNVFEYGSSDYIREFGLNVNTDGLPMGCGGRLLNPPKLAYKNKDVIPRAGAWNMADTKLNKPETINGWILLILDIRMPPVVQQRIAQGFTEGCESVGITFGANPEARQPLIQVVPPEQATKGLSEAGVRYKAKVGKFPSLVVAVLPDGPNALIYDAIKYFGICHADIATQCLKINKCSHAKIQYWANVALKVNAKLGGINVVPKMDGPGSIGDPAIPTIVLGADVTHPPPNSASPSYAALVSSVDSLAAKYISSDRVQNPREEMIAGLKDMTVNALQRFIAYREKVEKLPLSSVKPKRLLYYRDGVSDGEYSQVLEREVAAIKAACVEVGVTPLITAIVVVKRHHIRLMTEKKENIPAGAVFDRDITSPIEFDFYLFGHTGILGTSRSGRYTVLYDDNRFTADAIQKLSFTLCHTYARATRSVSIPTPVYYAHLVCAKAKLHYNPSDAMRLNDGGTNTSDGSRLMGDYVSMYRDVKPNQLLTMWWM